MNILVLNCGSSSVKYKLIEIKANKALAEGGVEKIGLHDAFIKFKVADGSKKNVSLNITNHNEAIKAILDILTSAEYGCIKAFDEIDAVGHRVVHGGEKFNKAVAENLESGTSYKRSLSSALQKFGADEKLVTSPNGVLALEYAKAIKNTGADIKILPIQRKGAGYNDSGLKDEFSSASAIRANLNDEKVAENVPPYVFEALQKTDTVGAALRADALIRYALSESEKKDMARIFGCSEGLENKLKADMNLTAEELIARATNKRYTSSRIRRILTANMLKLYSDDVKSYISEGTYIRPLAIRGSLKDEIFAEFARSELPVIIKKMSLAELTDGNCAARNCYSADLRADFVRALIFNESPEYEYTVRII